MIHLYHTHVSYNCTTHLQYTAVIYLCTIHLYYTSVSHTRTIYSVPVSYICTIYLSVSKTCTIHMYNARLSNTYFIHLYHPPINHTHVSYTCIIHLHQTFPLRPAFSVRVFRFFNAEPSDCRLGHLVVAEGFLTGGAVGRDVGTPGVRVSGTPPA